MLILLHLLGLCGYAVYLGVQLKGGNTPLTWLLALAALAHLGGLLVPLVVHADFGFFSALSLASWMCLVLVLVVPRLGFALVWLVPAAMLGLALQASLSDSYQLTSHNNLALVVHASVSMLALALCSLCWLVLCYQRVRHNQLKHLERKPRQPLPSLESIQRLAQLLLYASLLVLGLGIVSGLVFIENFFGQHLAHKSLLSLMAWLVLLFTAMREACGRLSWHGFFWLVALATGLLLLSYFGSRFVLEFLLGGG